METKEFICAFSSDFRELYKADIYKVLSMPKNAIVHFRYKTKYVDQAILDAISSYKSKEVIIFFSANNNLDNPTQNISVRKSKLVRAELIPNTGLFHAYMKLGDFCDIGVPPQGQEARIPPYKFFTLANCEIVAKNQHWIDKVEVFKAYFKDLCFYNIKGITTSNHKLKSIKNRHNNKSSYYKLQHGNKYFAELSIANPNEAKCTIKFKSSSDDLSANISNPIGTTAYYDDLSIPVYLKSLNVSSELSFISFRPENDNAAISEYELNIEIEKSIGWMRPLVFGLFSVLAVASIWVINDNSSDLATIFSWSWKINFTLVTAIAILLVSTAVLFSQFNKK